MHQLKVKGIVNNSAEPDEGLSRRVVRGGAWVFALRVTERAFSMQIYDRDTKPCPHDFGVVRIAPLTTVDLKTCSHMGLQEALIRKF